MFVDSHCHLDFPELQADMAAVLANMRANTVSHALTISTTLKSFPAVRAVAESQPNIWCTAGVHPDEQAALMVRATGPLLDTGINGFPPTQIEIADAEICALRHQ